MYGKLQAGVWIYCVSNKAEPRLRGWTSGRCMLGGKLHFNWNVYTLPMDNTDAVLFSDSGIKESSAFYKGKFEVDKLVIHS